MPSCPPRSASRRCRPVPLLAIATFGALDGFPAGMDDKFKAVGREINDEHTWSNMEVVTWDRTTNVKAADSDPRHPAGFGKVETMH